MSDFAATRAAHAGCQADFRSPWPSALPAFRARDCAPAPAGGQRAQDPIPTGTEVTLEEQVAQAYQQGWADGQAALAEANNDLLAAASKLAEAASCLAAQPPAQLTAALIRTVRDLLQETAGLAVVDADRLRLSCRNLAALAEAQCAGAVLHLHPADHALLEAGEPGLPLRSDPALARGTVVLAHQDGWIEQGLGPLLDELAAMETAA